MAASPPIPASAAAKPTAAAAAAPAAPAAYPPVPFGVKVAYGSLAATALLAECRLVPVFVHMIVATLATIW